MGRITYGKSMSQFSCKISCTPDLWNPRESRLNGKSREAVATNTKLDKLLLSINEAHSTLMERKQPFVAADVKNLFQGSIETQITLLRRLDIYTDELKSRVGVMVRANIRAILKSGVVTADTEHGGTIFGNTLYPDYYRLDMVVALAFRIQSPRTNIFREWVLRKCITTELFGTKRPAITKHLKNIFTSGELVDQVVCSKMEHTT